MFQFPGLPPRSPIWFGLRVRGHDPRRVPPFGHLRIDGCLPLPADYRSLPRPSSASCAKASAVRLVYLLFPKAAPRWRGAVSSFYRYCIPEALASRDRAGLLGPARDDAINVARYADVKVPGAGAGEAPRSPGSRMLRPLFVDGAKTALLFQVAGASLDRVRTRKCLPRKEVIQPHLPVRLPCYDFTPLTLHTFDASAPFGFGRRLRVQTTRVV